MQLNTLLFAKTLVRKDVAGSSAPSKPSTETSTPATSSPTSPAAAPAPLPGQGDSVHVEEQLSESKVEDDFSTKAQIMTLMTTDVDRVSEFAYHSFSLVGKFNSYSFPDYI